MAKTQRISIRNLDQMVEDVFGVGGNIFEPISYEELEKHFTSDCYKTDLTYDHHFALFKLIHENPKKAIQLLERTAKYQRQRSKYQSYVERSHLRRALEAEYYMVSWAKHHFFTEFLRNYPALPHLYDNEIDYGSLALLAIVKSNPRESLKFFQECYEQVAEKYKKKKTWEAYKPQILMMIKALKTKDFDIKALKTKDFNIIIQPEHLELKVTPKKETIKVPENINITNPAKLSRYLMQLEKASLKNVGLIENKAILIPRQGAEDWSKGLYIVTYNSTKLTDKVYKTEKPHTYEKIVSTTTGKGKVIRKPLEKIALTLIDLA